MFNSFLTDDDTRSFYEQCRSRSDRTGQNVQSDLRSTLSTFSFLVITKSFLHLTMEEYFQPMNNYDLFIR